MRNMLFISAVALAVSGCVDSDALLLDTSRKAAKSVVTPIIADKFPGRNTAAYTDCVIDNATTDEIVGLAKDAVTGADGETINTVVRIASRSGTIKCFVKVETGLTL